MAPGASSPTVKARNGRRDGDPEHREHQSVEAEPARLGGGQLGMPAHRADRKDGGKEHRRRHDQEGILRNGVDVADRDLLHRQTAIEQSVQGIGEVDENGDDGESECGQDEDPDPALEYVAVKGRKASHGGARLRPCAGGGGDGARRRGFPGSRRPGSSRSRDSPG